MAEPLPTVLDRNEDTGNYQPIALLAVIAIVVAAVFCAIVLVLTLVGLVTRRSVLEPWLIGLAVLGILLSIAARWQISISEGTRGGRKLASIAWWLSVVGGCVYGAYYGGNVLAIQKQATTFVNQTWFKSLQDGKGPEAFFFTVDPEKRKGMLVSDITKRFGDVFEPFLRERLPRLLGRGGSKCEIESLGMAQWQQGINGLEVLTRFLIRTSEGQFEVLVPVIGTENRETGAREWSVKRQGISILPVYLTNFGMAMERLQKEADGFLFEWTHDMRQGPRRVEMYLCTLPMSRDERKVRYHAFVTQSLVVPMLTDMLSYPYGIHLPFMTLSRFQPDAAVSVYYPQVDDLSKSIVRWDQSKQKRSAAELQQMLPLILQPGYVNPSMAAQGGPDAITTMQVSPKQLKASLTLEVTLPVLRYRSGGTAIAVCDDPKFMAELNRLAEQPPAAGDESYMREMWRNTPHHWRVSEVVIDLARDMNDQRPVAPASGIHSQRVNMPR